MPSKKVLGGIALAAVLTIATVITVPAVLVRNGADGAGVTTSTSTSTTTGESQSAPPPSVGSAAIVPPTSIPSSPTTRPSSLPVPSPVVEPDTSVPIATTPVQIAGDEMGEVGLQDAGARGHQREDARLFLGMRQRRGRAALLSALPHQQVRIHHGSS